MRRSLFDKISIVVMRFERQVQVQWGVLQDDKNARVDAVNSRWQCRWKVSKSLIGRRLARIRR